MSLSDNRFKIIGAGALALAVVIALGVALLRRTELFPSRLGQPPRGFGVTAQALAGSGSATIGGLVLMPNGTPQTARLTLVRSGTPRPQQLPRRGGPGRNSLTTTAGPDGRFEIRFVPAGSYWLVAHAEVIGAAPSLPAHYWSAREVVAEGGGAVETRVALEPAVTISGRLTINRRTALTPPDINTVNVQLYPGDARTQALASLGAVTASVDGAGGFVFTGIAPGLYQPDVSIEHGWSLESATIDGRDWLDRPLDVTSVGATSRASLVLTDHPNEIAGIVRGKSGEVAPYSLVMVFTEDAAIRTPPRRARAVRAGPDGRFSLTGFPAGEYLVAVADDLPTTAWFTPEGYGKLAGRATRVTMQVGAAKGVTLVR